ncbi:hypothetical protein JG725_18955 [Brenneria sp. L3-3C-1]|nr:hypothetical protein [Brenneria sp. L3-3C-1]
MSVRGTSVSQGYLMSKGKTQEKFIQNPMNDKYSDTMYKTGYLVFTDDAGFLLFR